MTSRLEVIALGQDRPMCLSGCQATSEMCHGQLLLLSVVQRLSARIAVHSPPVDKGRHRTTLNKKRHYLVGPE